MDKKMNTIADNIKDEESRKKFLTKMEKMKELINEPVANNDYLWDVTVERYATNIEKVKRVLATEEISDQVSNKILKNFDNFLMRCSNAEFHIALVGAIKAGKSTLINALLGYELASTSVTPETASLTKFRASKEGNYVKVTFYSEKEWAVLWKSAENARAEVFLEEYKSLHAETEKNKWLNCMPQIFKQESLEGLIAEINKWTSSKSPAHYFVKEVEVGLENFSLPEGVVLVDTPGLDDVVEYRSNITREYIDRANAVLVCVRSDALTGQEMATIYSVFANTRYRPEKVYIVATQLDTLNRPEENWKSQHAEWTKYLKSDSCYGRQELAEKNLVAVSAYFYTLLKQYTSLDEDRQFEFQSTLLKFRVRENQLPENYQRLMDFTNIDFLKDKLKHEIIDNYKSYLIEDIRENYDVCQTDIGTLAHNIQKQQREIIEVSERGLDAIRSKREEYTTKLKATDTEKKDLEKLLKKMRSATTDRANELIGEIRSLGRN